MISKCKLENCVMTKVIADDENGELVCINCGSVLEEKLVSQNEFHAHSLEEFMGQTRTGPKNSLTMYDKGMNSVIGNRDSSGRSLTAFNKSRFRRLRLWDSRSKMKNSTQRTLNKSLIFLNSMKEKLGIHDLVLESTAYLFRKIMEAGLTRGRDANSLMSAALYVSCRQTSTPRSLMDIAKVGNITKKSLQKNVRIIIRRLNLEMPQYDISSFITRMSNNFNFDEKTKRFALKILKDVEKKGLVEGKHPIGQAVASLYLASMLNGYSVGQQEFAQTSGITAVTLRNRVNTIRNALNL
ncbi:MAG TPA: transcription factor TFIIB [Nitrosopumilaceae archaeon]|nr:transcription factor TFIIB [Nitrosopumilaceae archaeon]